MAFCTAIAHSINGRNNEEILSTTKDIHLLIHSETEQVITPWIPGAKEPTVNKAGPGYLTTYPS